MDTRLLHTFLAVVGSGSLAGAAAELHLAQSTVTVHLQSLEKEFGVRLFDRLPRGTRPTDAGRRLVEGAREVLDAETRLHALARADGPVGGAVAVAAGETLCAALLPPAVAALRRAHPGVELSLHAAGTAAALDGLRAGRFDLALLLEDGIESAPEVAAEPIGAEPLVLLAAPSHPLVGRHRAVGWAELAGEDFFLLEEGCSYSDRLAGRLLAAEGPRPRLTRFGSAEAARACAAAGLGLTALPRAAAAGALGQGVLAEVRGPRLAPVPVLLARHRRRWVSPATRLVEAELRRRVAH